MKQLAPWKNLCMFTLMLVAGMFVFFGWVWIDFQDERERRVHQTCLVAEQRHASDAAVLVHQVRSVQTLYLFLASEHTDPTLRKLATDMAKERERYARILQRAVEKGAPPAFCNQPGVGSPEPGPIVPRTTFK